MNSTAVQSRSHERLNWQPVPLHRRHKHAAVLASTLLLGGAATVGGLEMEPMPGGCLQVTFKVGDQIKVDPRCIVSRGVGLALRPPAKLDRKGVLKGLRHRLRWDQENRRETSTLQVLSHAMTSNLTDCHLAPPFPGEITLVSISGGETETETETEVEGDNPNAPPPLSSRRRSGRAHSSDGRREAPPVEEGGRRRSSSSSRTAAAAAAGQLGRGPASKRKRKRRNLSSTTRGGPDHYSGNPRSIVVLRQAIVAVGPNVTVKPIPSVRRAGGSPLLSEQERDGRVAKTGALFICEGQGPVALAGCGKLRKLRLRSGQRRLVDASRAVGWTGDAMCFIGPRKSRGGGGSGNTGSSRNGHVINPPAVYTFVGPGTVYFQTHSLSGLRRLLLPKLGATGSRHTGGSPFLFGIGGGERAPQIPQRGAAVGLSLKRGLAKGAKAALKRVSLALALFALYLVVYSLATALLLEGRDGLVKAPRHAVQVVRSLVQLARRVAVVLIRLGREELLSRREDGAGNSKTLIAEGR